MVSDEPKSFDLHSGGAERGCRVELRCPDPSANPYLLLAVCLAAGLDGIRNEILPPDSIDKNIFEMTAKERKENGIESLPNNLLEAVCEMEKDEFVRGVLGEHFSERYIHAKKRSGRSTADMCRHGRLSSTYTGFSCCFLVILQRKAVSLAL